MFNSIFSVFNSQMNSQNVGRNGKRYKKKQRDRTKSDLKKYHSSWMDAVPKDISGLLFDFHMSKKDFTVILLPGVTLSTFWHTLGTMQPRSKSSTGVHISANIKKYGSN